MINRKIAVVGLGYVGLPVAVEFGKKLDVIGFDINEKRIEELKRGFDRTNEVDSDDFISSSVDYISNPVDLSKANFIIVAVPTPINENNQPDLSPLMKSSEVIGKYLSKGTIVVYESTVYPGATEEECVPVLEGFGIEMWRRVFCWISPERINPGDKEHTFRTITKVVSGQNDEILEVVANVYKLVVEAGVYKASSIKVAEAAKVIENTQRDLNIALMNELSVIFERLEIDTAEVLAAAGTKWNFLNFTPGLVGGHCIGVDPYYLTHKAQKVGHHPEVILSGRKTNDNVGKFIAMSLVKQMIKKNMPVQGSTVTILGFTFKENVPDIRNTRVIDVVRELMDFDINIQITDSHADSNEALEEYGISLMKFNDLKPADAVVFAVPHEEYLEEGWGIYNFLLKHGKGIVFDVKSMLDKNNKPKEIYLKRL